MYASWRGQPGTYPHEGNEHVLALGLSEGRITEALLKSLIYHAYACPQALWSGSPAAEGALDWW